jgi:Thioesterase-like superfamily
VTSFYVEDGPGRFRSESCTAGPWNRASQHGGPPAALLTRAIEQLEHPDPDRPDRVIGRLTMELLGPVPVGPLSVTASVLRPGRSVELCGATLYDVALDRPVATAAAWLFPMGSAGPEQQEHPLSHGPEDGVPHDRPATWSSGYLDAVDWRWVSGAVDEPGPGVVWMRPTVDLVDGEPMSPIQRLMCCVDSASGVSAALDIAAWAFLNTELTVHVLRPPVGEWVCLDAQTTLSSGNVGVATSHVYDERGLAARSSQALLIAKR